MVFGFCRRWYFRNCRFHFFYGSFYFSLSNFLTKFTIIVHNYFNEHLHSHSTTLLNSEIFNYQTSEQVTISEHFIFPIFPPKIFSEFWAFLGFYDPHHHHFHSPTINIFRFGAGRNFAWPWMKSVLHFFWPTRDPVIEFHALYHSIFRLLRKMCRRHFLLIYFFWGLKCNKEQRLHIPQLL